MRYILSYSLILILMVTNLHAQFLPPNQPEQNACDALIVCGNGFYSPYTYKGNGTINDLLNTPCDDAGLSTGEDNAMWLKLVITSPGIIVFKIKPVAVQDDYDWAVLNITNKSCNNLTSSDVVRCNFNNNQPVFNNGITGLSTTATQTGVIAGTTGQPFCKFINAQAGEVYLIMINNFGVLGQGLTSGFSIEFTGSTATFNNTGHPKMSSLNPSCNTKKQITLKTNKPVKCSSIASNGSDFFLTPSGTISSAQGVNCNVNGSGYTDEIIIIFNGNLPPGNYTLKAKSGTDNNTLLDLCDNDLILPDSLQFYVPVLESQVTDTICPNEFPYSWNGITVNTGGTNIATKTFPNQTGCDSIVRLSLFVVDTLKSVETVTICPQELPYTWNGIVVNAGGNQVAQYLTLNNANCDSLVTLNLIVQQAYSQTFSLSGCGEILFNNKTYTQSQNNILDTIISSFGCDSVYATLNLIVFPVNPITKIIDTAACGNLILNGINYTSSQTILDTLRNQHGCDSVYKTINITIYPDIAEEKTEYLKDCEKVLFKGIQYTEDIDIIDTFYNILGCDSLIRTTKIRPEHFRLSLTVNPEHPVKDVLLILQTQANADYYDILSWEPANLFLNQHLYEQQILADESTTFKVKGKSLLGCLDSAQVNLVVDSLVPVCLMPNAFTPNGDGVNDVFMPFFVNETGYKIQEFKVYNRLGQLVYTAGGVLNAGWNGNYYNQAKPAEAGVYFYYINVIFVNGKQLNLKGDVTLIR